MSNFIQLCLNGTALLDDIDNYIELWHDSETNLELHDFLGFTQQEYSLWLEDSSLLPYIIIAHREKRKIDDVIKESSALPLAARADSQRTVEELVIWLQEKGLWK